MTEPRILTFPDLAGLAAEAVLQTAQAARDATATRGEFVLVLAGGSTPGPVYEALAQAPAGLIPWEKTRILWSDERCVPPDSDLSNFNLARQTLLSKVAISPDRIHRIEGELPPEVAASRYEALLQSLSTRAPLFDLVFLGMGPDGHTASLFPGEPDLPGLVAAVTAPDYITPRARVTMTEQALNRAAKVLFMLQLQGKEAAFAQVTAGAPNPESNLPAARISPAELPQWLVVGP